MNETVLTIEDAARCLPDLVERVHARGEPALLTKAGRPVARIVPVPEREESPDSLIAFLSHWRSEHPEPDDQLAEVIAESSRACR
jgi:prevent-host-death family protein